MGSEESTPASSAEEVLNQQVSVLEAVEEQTYSILIIPCFSFNPPYIIKEAATEAGWAILLGCASSALRRGNCRVFDLSDGDCAVLVDGVVCWENVEVR